MDCIFPTDTSIRFDKYIKDPEQTAAQSVYHQLHTSMMQSFRNGDHDASDRLARQLLLHADLPKTIRARCHMVLGTGDGDYLRHAEEGVRLMEEMDTEYYEFPKARLDQARSVLKKAQQDKQVRKKTGERFGSDAVEGKDQEERGE